MTSSYRPRFLFFPFVESVVTKLLLIFFRAWADGAKNSSLGRHRIKLGSGTECLIFVCLLKKRICGILRNSEIKVYFPNVYCEDTIIAIQNLGFAVGRFPIEVDHAKLYTGVDVSGLLMERGAIIVCPHLFGSQYHFNVNGIFMKDRAAWLCLDQAHIHPFEESVLANGFDFSFNSLKKHLLLRTGATLQCLSSDVKNIKAIEIEAVRRESGRIAGKRSFIRSIIFWVRLILIQVGCRKPLRFFVKGDNFFGGNINTYFGSVDLVSEWLCEHFFYSRYVVAESNRIRKNTIWAKLIFNLRGLSGLSEAVLPYLVFIKSLKGARAVRYGRRLEKLGIPVVCWPQDVSELHQFSDRDYSLYLMAGSDFLGLNTKKLLKRRLIRSARRLTCDLIGRDEFVALAQSLNGYIPFNQAPVYVENRLPLGWNVMYYSVSDENGLRGLAVCRFFSFLSCKFIVVSDVLLRGENRSAVEKFEVINAVWSKLRSWKVVFVSSVGCDRPLEYATKESILSLVGGIGPSSKGTFVADLGLGLETLMARLCGKTRNVLKKGTALNDCKIAGPEDLVFGECIKIYQHFMRDTNFAGFPIALIYKIIDANPGAFSLYYTEKDGRIEGFVLIASAHSTATYLVGWSSEVGRHSQCNTYLLWTAITKSWERGCRFFDLGGFDEVKTPSIMKFKMGFNFPRYSYSPKALRYL